MEHCKKFCNQVANSFSYEYERQSYVTFLVVVKPMATLMMLRDKARYTIMKRAINLIKICLGVNISFEIHASAHSNANNASFGKRQF